MLEERPTALPLQPRAPPLNASLKEMPPTHSLTTPKTIPPPKQLIPRQEPPLRMQALTCNQLQATTTQPQEPHDTDRLPTLLPQLLKPFLDHLLRPMKSKVGSKKGKEKSRPI